MSGYWTLMSRHECQGNNSLSLVHPRVLSSAHQGLLVSRAMCSPWSKFSTQFLFPLFHVGVVSVAPLMKVALRLWPPVAQARGSNITDVAALSSRAPGRCDRLSQSVPVFYLAREVSAPRLRIPIEALLARQALTAPRAPTSDFCKPGSLGQGAGVYCDETLCPGSGGGQRANLRGDTRV